MIITKIALPRRTFLRGIGVSLALPLLDAMVPAATALAQTAASPVRRLGFLYVPNGVIQEQWVPATTGAGFDLSPILSPLAPYSQARRIKPMRSSMSPGPLSSALLQSLLQHLPTGTFISPIPKTARLIGWRSCMTQRPGMLSLSLWRDTAVLIHR